MNYKDRVTVEDISYTIRVKEEFKNNTYYCRILTGMAKGNTPALLGGRLSEDDFKMLRMYLCYQWCVYRSHLDQEHWNNLFEWVNCVLMLRVREDEIDHYEVICG